MKKKKATVCFLTATYSRQPYFLIIGVEVHNRRQEKYIITNYDTTNNRFIRKAPDSDTENTDALSKPHSHSVSRLAPPMNGALSL
jgi:hypothetical protein